MLKFFSKRKRSQATEEPKALPYTHCLNCGTELQGKFCHKCGQEAVSKVPTIKDFVVEYINNAFIWDSNFISTFWTLISRPGRLTNEYNEGKFIRQEHPLKLNMFLLFVFISLFVFFASAEKMTTTMNKLTTNESVFSGVQIQLLADDAEYAKKMTESPRDTILLQAPLSLANSHPDILTNIEIKEKSSGKSLEENEILDKWVAVVPKVLIEDKIVVLDKDGYYHFNVETKRGKDHLELFSSIIAEIIRLLSNYFPILLLLTIPFLTFSLRMVQRKSKIPTIHHLIFSLHFAAFLEFLIICVYILYLTIAPPLNVLQYGLMLCSCVYMAIAYHRVYPTTWFSAIAKSLLTSLIYFCILLLVFMVIVFAACIIIVAKMA